MKPILLLLLCGIAVCAAFHEVAAQTQAGAPDSRNEKRKVSETVQLTTKIVSQQYCAQVIEPQHQETQLMLWLKLTLKNVSNESLIVPRYANNIYNVFLSRSLAQAQAKRYVYDAHYSFMRLDSFTRREFTEAAPTDEFIILMPGEFHEYEYKSGIDISLTNLDEPPRNLRPGDYFLEVKIATWQWRVEQLEELQQRWASYGYLWGYDVKSLPMPIRVEKQSSPPPICQ